MPARVQTLADGCKQHAFYEIDGSEGRHCFFNTAHVTRLNLLEHLAGLHVEAKPELSGDEAEEEDDVRAISDEPVIVRLWLRDTEVPVVHHEVDYEKWKYLKVGVSEGEKFIHFTDEDAEDVIYAIEQIDAIEMFDPFYLDDDMVERILEYAENESPEALPERPLPGLPPPDA